MIGSEEVLCSGDNNIKIVRVLNDDGSRNIKFSYSFNVDIKEEIFKSIFNDYEKATKEIFERVKSTLNKSGCA